jgi:3-deoxy-D-arabino-heptulosonate 7-phosphate (DAHP) synthase class II
VDSFSVFVSSHIAGVVLVLAVVALAGAAVAVGNVARLGRITGRFAWATGENAETSDTLPSLLGTVEKNARDIAEIKGTIERILTDGKTHFKRIGLVRYDAFDGVAGQQSYSLCLLNDKKDGFLITTLVGKDFARSYAVEIRGGEAGRKLGDEEAGALGAALAGA